MRVLFHLENIEYHGEAQQLSRHGIFVSTDQQNPPRELELLLDTDGDAVSVVGEVVRVTKDGFAVAFRALHPDTIHRLNKLLHPQSGPESTDEKATQEGARAEGIQVVGVDWTPPVTEPILHEWKPDTELVPPPAPESEKPGWEKVPTISPTKIAQKTEAAEPPSPIAGPATQVPAEPTPPPAVTPEIGAKPEPQPSIDYSERRQTVRVEQSIPVTFDNLTTLIKEFTHNISFGGLFVYTTRPMERGAEAAVTLIHPVHGERLSLLAKVAHSSTAPSPDPVTGTQRYGIGLEFRIPIEELKRLLSDFISSHQKPKLSSEANTIVEEAKELLARGANSEHTLLGLSENASKDEIRRAYFQLVDRFHPDRYFGKVTKSDQKILEDLFRSLTKAYEKLLA